MWQFLSLQCNDRIRQQHAVSVCGSGKKNPEEQRDEKMKESHQTIIFQASFAPVSNSSTTASVELFCIHLSSVLVIIVVFIWNKNATHSRPTKTDDDSDEIHSQLDDGAESFQSFFSLSFLVLTVCSVMKVYDAQREKVLNQKIHRQVNLHRKKSFLISIFLFLSIKDRSVSCAFAIALKVKRILEG